MLQKTMLTLSAVMLLALAGSAQSQTQLDYIDRYKDIAIQEMERAGIPASIKLAQGILESNAGQSYLARRANNHFGIKCGNDWNGKKVYREDDDYDDKGKLQESCFRGYRTAEASFIAHSEFLRDPKKSERYGFLFRLDPTDYRRWAHGLKQSGYATSASYHRKLIDIIERYKLYELDRMTSIDLVSPGEDLVVDDIAGVLVNNDVKYVLSIPGETLADVARRTDNTLRSLLNYNEMVDEGDRELDEGTKVYLQPKRNAYRGKKTWHYMKEGETMFDISQLYGVKLTKLYHRNRIPMDKQPAVGERLKLRGWCKVKEQPTLASEAKFQPEPPMPELIIDEDDDGNLEMEFESEPFEEDDFQPEVAPKPPKPPVPAPKPENKPPVFPAPNPDIDKKENTQPQVKEEELPYEPPAPDVVAPRYHTVVKGDTLWNISQRYNMTVDELKSLNNLQSNNISIGAKLRVE